MDVEDAGSEGRGEKFLVAGEGEADVEDGGVVDGETHEDADEMVLFEESLVDDVVESGEPVDTGVLVVAEHAVVGIEDLADEELEPFLLESAHVESHFAGEVDA